MTLIALSLEAVRADAPERRTCQIFKERRHVVLHFHMQTTAIFDFVCTIEEHRTMAQAVARAVELGFTHVILTNDPQAEAGLELSIHDAALAQMTVNAH